MIDSVARIIEIYENEGVEGLLSTPSMPDDIRKAALTMDRLEAAEKEKIEAILRAVLKGTEKRITELESEITDEMQNLKQSQENADACIAYLNSAQTGDKK